MEAQTTSSPARWTSWKRLILRVAEQPQLSFLHADESLNAVDFAQFERLTTETLRASLLPRHEGSLKARPDGTLLDGHHRIAVLRTRGVDVNALPSRDCSEE